MPMGKTNSFSTPCLAIILLKGREAAAKRELKIKLRLEELMNQILKCKSLCQLLLTTILLQFTKDRKDLQIQYFICPFYCMNIA